MLSPSTAARYQTLLEVTESIVSHQQFAELLAQIGEAMRRIIHFHGVSITLFDPKTETIRLLAIDAAKEPPVKPGIVLPISETPASIARQSGQPFYSPDIDAGPQFPNIYSVMRAAGVRSFAIFPLSTARNRFIGTLNFGSLEVDAYGPADIEIMNEASRPVAIALENAMHYDAMLGYQLQLASERDHLRLLLEINNAVISHMDAPSLIESVSECLRKHFRVENVSILIPAADQKIREPQIREGDRCLVPLIFRGVVLGTLSLTSTVPAETFSESNIQLLCEVAGQIAIALDNALSYRKIEELNARLAEEKLYLEDEIRTQFGFEEIIGRSPALLSVLRMVETVAPSDSAVVIGGETGTGKELIARAIHDLSGRRDRTFVKLNCAAIPGGLLESELFGHEKGAFTGAIARRIGRFELAHGGTLFLDEIGEIPLELQPKLLRVLQEREFERLGSSHTLKVDVRVVAATNRDLMQMVRERRFRDDLYYRINVFPITVPPLRERREDIPVLVRHFVQHNARRMRKEITSIPGEAMDLLTRYDWPGNVRELQNVVERAVIVTQGPVLQIPADQLRKSVQPVGSGSRITLEDAERDHILQVLQATRWVLAGPSGAAVRLGLKRSTLQFRMKKLGIERPR